MVLPQDVLTSFSSIERQHLHNNLRVLPRWKGPCRKPRNKLFSKRSLACHLKVVWHRRGNINMDRRSRNCLQDTSLRPPKSRSKCKPIGWGTYFSHYWRLTITSYYLHSHMILEKYAHSRKTQVFITIKNSPFNTSKYHQRRSRRHGGSISTSFSKRFWG